MLLLPVTAAAIDNPDGKPGTFALEPGVSYLSIDEAGSTIGEESTTLSLALIVPLGSRVTVFGQVQRSSLTFDIRGAGLFPDADNTNATGFRLSLRIWLGAN